MSQRSWTPALVGFLALVPLIVASYLAAYLAFAVYYRLPDYIQKSGWTGYVLKYVAPAVGGLVGTLGVVALLTRRRRYHPSWRGHFVRAATWYLAAGWVQWVVFRNAGISDFGLWGQIIIWPQAAFLSAAATDAVVSIHRARRLRAHRVGLS